jgi:hypothetical protein
MAIEADIINRIKKFGKWANKEINNGNIFVCNPHVHHKENVIEINRGKMLIRVTDKGFWVTKGTYVVAYGDKLEEVLLSALNAAIRDHYVNSNIE